MKKHRKVILTSSRFRLVSGLYGNRYLEVRNGVDALGVPRWVDADMTSADEFRRFRDDVARCLLLRAKRRRRAAAGGRS